MLSAHILSARRKLVSNNGSLTYLSPEKKILCCFNPLCGSTNLAIVELREYEGIRQAVS